MTPTNTEALAIAEALEKRLDCSSLVLTADVERAAAELRRLSAELALLEESNAQLREQNTAVDKACAALEAENSKLLAKVEVAEAGYEAAVRRAEWQATTNAELNRLTEQRNQARAERDALRAALVRVLDTREREAKAYLTAQVASENFSKRSAKADEHAHLQAAMEASKAEKEARELLAAMKGTKE